MSKKICKNQENHKSSNEVDCMIISSETHSKFNNNQVTWSGPQLNCVLKIIFIIFSFANVNVCNSSSLSSLVIKPQLRRSSVDNMPVSVFTSKKVKEMMFNPSEGSLIRKLLTRKSRSSNDYCRTIVEKIVRLSIHAYVKSDAAHATRIRRKVSQRLRRRSSSVHRRWQDAYNHLKFLECKLNQIPVLFGKETAAIKILILSMLSTLEFEMRNRGLVYTETSCITDNRINSLTFEAESFVNQLFNLSQDLERICSRISSQQ